MSALFLTILSIFFSTTLASDQSNGFLKTLISTKESKVPGIRHPTPNSSTRPIIGIIATPSSAHSPYTSYIMAAYSKFAQAGGARVIPIPYDLTIEEVFFRMDRVNGVIIPGGGDDLINKNGSFTEYTGVVKEIYEYAKKKNQEMHYPVLATCLGFEQIVLFEDPNLEILGTFDSMAYPTTLVFEDDVENITLFRGVDSVVTRENLTYHNHFRGYNYSLFFENPSIKSSYRVTSYSIDRQGLKFASSIEHLHYPFSGIQFHPEKAIFIWNDDDYIPHSEEAVRFSQDLTNNFVRECRKNSNKFETRELEKKYIIENAELLLTDGGSQDIYLF